MDSLPPFRYNNPMVSRPQKPKAPSLAPPRIRPSLRTAGLAVALVPWIFWPGSGVLDPFGPIKYSAAALALTTVLALIIRENPAISLQIRTPFHLGALFIVFGLILSSLFSPVPLLGLRMALRESLFILAAVILAKLRPASLERRWIVLCFVVSAGTQSVLALFQHFIPQAVAAVVPNLALAANLRRSMIGTIGNAEYLAGWLAPAAAAGAVYAWQSRSVSPRPRALMAASAALALLAIFLSGGRGAALAAGLSALIAFFLMRDSSADYTMIVAGGRGDMSKKPVIALMILALLFGAWSAIPEDSRRGMLPARLAELVDPHSSSLRGRIGLYAFTAQMIREHPLFGSGPGRFGAEFGATQRRLAADESGIAFWSQADMMAGQYIAEAHCDPLQWWAEYGLLPIVGLSLMLATALGRPLRRLRSEPELAALWTALLTFAFSMWVSFPLHEASRATAVWILMGVLAGTREEFETKKDKERDTAQS